MKRGLQVVDLIPYERRVLGLGAEARQGHDQQAGARPPRRVFGRCIGGGGDISLDLAAVLTQVSGLVGALIGGGTSLAVAVYNQRAEERLQRVANEIARRESVYTDFLENASKILLNTYTRDGIALGGDEQHLIALINRMRLFAPTQVVSGAEAMVRALVEISLQPSVELRQLATQALAKSPEPDPFLKFSVTCRGDLDKVRRTAR